MCWHGYQNWTLTGMPTTASVSGANTNSVGITTVAVEGIAGRFLATVPSVQATEAGLRIASVSDLR
jgi:hypothetical protein